MASETEPAKNLLPYLQRADELQKHEHLVAYYCRLYAMEKGLKIPQKERTQTTNSLLISLMNQLEKDKKILKLGPDDNLYVEGFASNVFAKADKQDRAGRADLGTAKTFYAASIFFEILNQFGALQPDIEQKQKYAIWKAAEIRKALKEGRRPIPGPPSDEDDLSISHSSTYDIGPSEPPSINPRHEPDQSQFHDSINDQQHSTNIPPPPLPKYYDNSNDQNPTNLPGPTYHHRDKPIDHQSPIAPQHHFHDEPTNPHLSSFPSVPSQTYPTSGNNYPSQDFPPPSDYHQTYHRQQSYGQDQPPHNNINNNNFQPPHENASPQPYTHFQSYPSFSESSLPSVPPNFPSHFQGSDGNYAPPPPLARSNGSGVGPASAPAMVPPPAPIQATSYEYDSNFQPPPEKVAAAQKAARFAVGALAFDDVHVAVDYLRKSLELLTNPSAIAGEWP